MTFADAFEHPPETSGLSNVPLRLILLILLILLANVWAAVHLGIDLKVVFGVEGTIALLGALRAGLKKGDDLTVDRFLKAILYFLLRTPVLITAWSLFLAVTLFVSSVNVTAAGATVDKVRLGGDVEPLPSHFIVLTTPLGRPINLEVAGYPSQDVKVFPWFPSNIRVGLDMGPATPTLLIRVPYPHYDLPGGEIRIIDVQRNVEIARVPTSERSASAIVGETRPLPDSLKDRWVLELTPIAPAGAHAAAILVWRNPQPPGKPVAIKPGMQLKAVFFEESQIKMHDTQPSAEKTFTVNGDPFQDVLLDDKRPPL